MEGPGRRTGGGWMETWRGDEWPGPMKTSAGWRSTPRGWDGSHAAYDRRWRTPGMAIGADNTTADVKDGNDFAARRG